MDKHHLTDALKYMCDTYSRHVLLVSETPSVNPPGAMNGASLDTDSLAEEQA